MPLAGPLSLLLPEHEQTLLLRAALHPPDRARHALEQWQADRSSPARDLATEVSGGRLLAPLIAANLAASRVSMDAELATYVRTALLRGRLRSETARRSCGDALGALHGAGIASVVLGGVAASETVYPDPSLRHCHDLDVLTPPMALDAAAGALAAAGFRAAPAIPPPPGARHLVHASGMPVVLHTEPFRVPWYRTDADGLVERAREVEILGVPTRILAPADRLLHLLLQTAASPSRGTLLWACDAWWTIRAEADLDWQGLVRTATAHRGALPSVLLLWYLARDLGAPVPEAVLESLCAQARSATRVDLEVALWGAWTVPRRRLGAALERAAGLRERAFVLRWRLRPSRSGVVAAGRACASAD